MFLTYSIRSVLAQGIVGCFPWQAMVFFTLWLQLEGFSDRTASLVVATFGAGVALVSVQWYGYVSQLFHHRLQVTCIWHWWWKMDVQVQYDSLMLNSCGQ